MPKKNLGVTSPTNPLPKKTPKKGSKSKSMDQPKKYLNYLNSLDENNLQHIKLFFLVVLMITFAVIFKDKITNINEVFIFLAGVFVGKK